MFATWEEEMEVLSMRMQVTLPQAAWTGLTQYTTILKMFKEHPGFPWGPIAALLPTYWENFSKAVTAIGNDKYYGFKQKMEVAAATRFLNLGYVAKEMIVKVGGREGSAITQFKGWITNPRGKKAIDDIIPNWDPDCDSELSPDHAAVAALGIEL